MMRLKKRWKIIFGFVILSLLIALLVIVLVLLAPHPPVEKIDYARVTLAQAGSSGAGTYSRRLYREAEVLYDSAMISWKKENQKFIYSRNFRTVEKYAELSAKKAEEALKSSQKNVLTLRAKVSQKIDTLNNLVVQINKLFTDYPLTSEVRNRISKGKLLLKESEIAYDKSSYIDANKKVTDAEYLLTFSYQNGINNLREYFRSFPVWKRWVEKTISESRENKSYSIIVDKYSRKCIVYLSGIRQYEYDVELGRNWVGDKKIRGDKATPEGMYKVVKKFGSNKTKYYRALLLNYPNEEDKTEFKKAIARGALPASAKIGGLIEIHGNGGKGTDWTEGCIALTDSEMEVIFKIAKEGTPVTIVGSMVDLKQVLD
jgi:L,D-peptidoglycan transpeptidase YkuD (ErfK/YbiS/YcfS/YnhG family)